MENKLDIIIEVIGNAVFENLPVEDPENDEIRQDISSVLGCLENAYVLVQWPKSQQFMEEEWFDEEAVLSDESSYFIPLNRII